MSDYYVLMMYPVFIVLGFVSPFITSLGYLWVDTFYPQYMSLLLKGFPVSLVMGLMTLIVYVLFDRRSPPRITLTMVLTLAMAVWVTLTTTWAVAPVDAWTKWDWAFKTVAYSALIPLFIRSRVQIEAFWQVFLFSCAIHIVPFGIKGMLSGGGYATKLGFLNGNIGMEEGSTLSAVSIMFIPIIIHLMKNSLLIPKGRFRTVMYSGYLATCCTAPIATAARTAIIGFAVLITFVWLQSRHKIVTALVIVITAVTLFYAAPDRWKGRMSTIENYEQEDSALSRLLIWKWTLDFVASRPQGGGFGAYVVDRIVIDDREYFSKAFHSIYFEVLGEHGYLGFAIFITLIGNTVFTLWRLPGRTRDSPELAWARDLGRAMFIAVLVLLACGAFIGIAFQPMLWYMFAMTTCLSQHVRQVMRLEQDAARPAGRFAIAQGAVAARLT